MAISTYNVFDEKLICKKEIILYVFLPLDFAVTEKGYAIKQAADEHLGFVRLRREAKELRMEKEF